MQKKLKEQKIFPKENILVMIVENFFIIALFMMSESSQKPVISQMLKFLTTFLISAMLITTGKQILVFLNTRYLKKNPNSMKRSIFQSSSYKAYTIFGLNLNITFVLLVLLVINPNIYTLGFFAGAVKVLASYYKYFQKVKDIEN